MIAEDDRLYSDLMRALQLVPKEGRGYIVQALAPIPKLYSYNGGFQEATRHAFKRLGLRCEKFLSIPS